MIAFCDRLSGISCRRTNGEHNEAKKGLRAIYMHRMLLLISQEAKTVKKSESKLAAFTFFLLLALWALPLGGHRSKSEALLMFKEAFFRCSC